MWFVTKLLSMVGIQPLPSDAEGRKRMIAMMAFLYWIRILVSTAHDLLLLHVSGIPYSWITSTFDLFPGKASILVGS